MGFFGGSRDREKRTADRQERLSRLDSIRLERIERRMAQERRGGMTTREMLGKGARMVKRGLDDVARSQSQPQSSGRPRISQLPTRKDMGIAQNIDLERMKMRGMRGKDLQSGWKRR